MLAVQGYLKPILGIVLTWACAGIFYYGLDHATVDHATTPNAVFISSNWMFFLAAPLAQSAFYILARKTSWLLNIYLAVSAICVAVFLYNVASIGGYRYTYWHQGDFLCVEGGCNNEWQFGFLVFLQGCMLWFASFALKGFRGFSPLGRAILRFVLVPVLYFVFLTSFFLMIA